VSIRPALASDIRRNLTALEAVPADLEARDSPRARGRVRIEFIRPPARRCRRASIGVQARRARRPM
jgi:hypothetical protein